MALYRCTNTGGSSPEEVTLWSNPDDTASFAVGQTINLSDDITNYRYLKFRYKISTSKDIYGTMIRPVSEVRETFTATNHLIYCVCGKTSSDGAAQGRIYKYLSDTSFEYDGYSSLGVSSSLIIPVSIVGIV